VQTPFQRRHRPLLYPPLYPLSVLALFPMCP
jgi:hypothetical protein